MPWRSRHVDVRRPTAGSADEPHGGPRPTRSRHSIARGAARALAHALVQQRQRDVVERAHRLDEVELLEDEPDHRSTDRRQTPVAERRHVVAGEHDASGCRSIEATEHLQAACSCPSPRARRWPATRRRRCAGRRRATPRHRPRTSCTRRPTRRHVGHRRDHHGVTLSNSRHR